MSQSIECGTYRVAETIVKHYAGYECAAWWQDIEVAAGEYPVYAHIEQGHVKRFVVTLPGVIVEDNFQSLFGGMPIGNSYDTKKNAGGAAHYHIQMHDYVVFDSIAHNPESSWQIDVTKLPNLGDCLNSECGSKVSIYKGPRYCPSCGVAREHAGKQAIDARHSFLLDAAYVVRPVEFASILDSTIYHYFEEGRQPGYHRDQIIKTIAGLRKAGPEGRKAARARYSPRFRKVA
jgi:hypothetical protein